MKLLDFKKSTSNKYVWIIDLFLFIYFHRIVIKKLTFFVISLIYNSCFAINILIMN